MLKQFKEFALRGYVLDMAIGIIIGGAFGKIVSSLVSDVFLPSLGLAVGKADFSNLFIDLSGAGIQNLAAARAAGVPTLNYGAFANTIVDFLMVSIGVFLIARIGNRMAAPAAIPQPETKRCLYCYSSIPLQAVRCRYCTSQLKP